MTVGGPRLGKGSRDIIGDAMPGVEAVLPRFT
jgi:hypothetical protein